MPTTLNEIMAEFSPAERAEIEQGGAEIVVRNRALRELRKSIGVTQDQLAEALETSQANVARIEGKGDLMVSTVARVVEALGGRLRMVVDMPGQPTTVLSLPVAKSSRAAKTKKAVRAKTARRRQEVA